MDLQHFLSLGWGVFPADPDLTKWVRAARPVAEAVASDPELRRKWLRCGETWFAGVNALPNDATGAVPGAGVPPLDGAVLTFLSDQLDLPSITWDRAQISVCYSGYPLPWQGESDAAFRYRRDRDAAHVDGLRRSDPGRRRFPNEAHAFILGIPLNAVPEGASPMVVWEDSHHIMRRALGDRLAGVKPQDWPAQDVTDAYTAARREVFETCKRIPVTAQPGQCYLVHRLALHGVAPWSEETKSTDSRMIAYFRPEADANGLTAAWLTAP